MTSLNDGPDHSAIMAPYKNLLLTVAGILLLSFLIIMINQAAQLIQLAMSIHPLFGKALLAVFLLFAAVAVIGTFLLVMRFDKPLAIPDEKDSEAYARYLLKLKQRLKKNRYLINQHYAWDPNQSDLDSIQGAYLLLDEQSQIIIKRSGSEVFLTTAVSQNGSLDSLFVFASLMKLVWQLAMLYHQRPAVRDLVKLYANVFAAVLLARQIDDIDLVAEQLEPVLSSLFGGTVGTLVPGISYIGSFIADSLMEGGLNTLLTLRVGIITQRYCRSLTKTEPRSIGRAASVQACSMLGSIVVENSKRISNALYKALKKAAVHPLIKGKNKFAEMYERMFPEKSH